MKLRYILLLVILIAVAVLVVYASSSHPMTSPPVFFNAQNKGKKLQQKGKKAPVLGKPAPSIKGKAPEEGEQCKPTDEYCITSKSDVCKASFCTAKKGQPCKYGDRHCVKSSPPPAQPQPADGGETNPVPVFEHCVDTRSAANCKSNTPCVHYTCKTLEDAGRINIDNVNIKCDKSGEREYDVLQCKTVGNVTYCGCAPIFADKSECPPGFVSKTLSTPCSPGELSLENISKLGRYPVGKPRMPQNYTVCVPNEPPTTTTTPSVDTPKSDVACEKNMVLRCKTVGNTTSCGCELVLAKDYGGKCPDGLVAKSVPYDHCTPGRPCTKVLKKHRVCVSPEQAAPVKR